MLASVCAIGVPSHYHFRVFDMYRSELIIYFLLSYTAFLCLFLNRRQINDEVR